LPGAHKTIPHQCTEQNPESPVQSLSHFGHKWQSVSNLKFKYDNKKPNVLISFSSTPLQHNHDARYEKGEYSNNFDGKGNVLALVSK
jgi:hypothetical protein